MRGVAIGIALAGVVMLWAGTAARQEVRSTPGPTSGIMTVRGTVDIGNAPAVTAAQQGEWRVAVSSAPPVVMAGPVFVVRGGRYTITWPTGTLETVTVVEPGGAGWAQVAFPAGDGRPRWVNLGAAIAVEQAP